MTNKSITRREDVERELSSIFKQGYAAAPDQALLGINAIAAPIFDDRDNCIATLAIVGSIQHLPEIDAKTIAALREAAAHISRKIGHGGQAPSRGTAIGSQAKLAQS